MESQKPVATEPREKKSMTNAKVLPIVTVIIAVIDIIAIVVTLIIVILEIIVIKIIEQEN